MPFTFSHPSILLPFLYLPRKWISVTGLVVGSMAPDFEYFLRMRMKSEYSHTLAGMFWFDLPVAILVAFVFHLIIRNPLIDHLPRFLSERFAVYKQVDWVRYVRENWLVVIISFLIGIGSHLLWDSFTHPTGFFARQIPILYSVVEIGSWTCPGSVLAQKISGVAGAGILVWLVICLPRQTHVEATPMAGYWLMVCVSVVVILFFRWLTFPRLLIPGHLVVAVIGAGFFSLVIAGGYIWIRSRMG